jgi:hypothetical protein
MAMPLMGRERKDMAVQSVPKGPRAVSSKPAHLEWVFDPLSEQGVR